MYGFLVLLHVLAVVLIIGPTVWVPMAGMRAINRGDVAAVKRFGRDTLLLSALSLLVFGTGVLALSNSPEYEFTSVWVVISATLYVIAIIIGLAVLPPALSQAAKRIDDLVPALDEGETGGPTTASETVRSAIPREQLQRTKGRIAALAGLLALLYIVIIVLMVLRPFSQ